MTETSAPTSETAADGNARWLAPTGFLDHDTDEVQAFATDAVGNAASDTDKCVRLFYAVRDGYWYDPYSSDREAQAFKASNVVGLSRSWCVPKSILLTAAARAVGVPARLGFADVRNHLQSEKLQEKMGTDLFVFHGYSEFLLHDRWVKASAAFNLELCERFGTKPLEFDGVNDALLHEFDTVGNRHMEYVRFRGSYDDFPHAEMVAAFDEVYESNSFSGAEPGETDNAFEPPTAG